jgi:ATP-binding cassette subfamily B protein
MPKRRTIFLLLSLLTGQATCTTTRASRSEIEYLGKAGVFLQRDSYDCGAAALKMVLDHFQIGISYEEVVQELGTQAKGTTMLQIQDFARSRDLVCRGWRIGTNNLTEIPLPAILLIRPNHFAVLSAIDRAGRVLLKDPARGMLTMPVRRLQSMWQGEVLLFSKPGARMGRHGRWFGLQ